MRYKVTKKNVSIQLTHAEFKRVCLVLDLGLEDCEESLGGYAKEAKVARRFMSVPVNHYDEFYAKRFRKLL